MQRALTMVSWWVWFTWHWQLEDGERCGSPTPHQWAQGLSSGVLSDFFLMRQLRHDKHVFASNKCLSAEFCGCTSFVLMRQHGRQATFSMGDAKDALVGLNFTQHLKDGPYHLVVLGSLKQKSILFRLVSTRWLCRMESCLVVQSSGGHKSEQNRVLLDNVQNH